MAQDYEFRVDVSAGRQTLTFTNEGPDQSGRTYAVVCFIKDRSGGPPPVIANDMKEIFTVEQGARGRGGAFM